MWQIDDCCEVYNEKTVTARKDHVCTACHEPIKAGTQYHYLFTIFHGNTHQYRRCMRCQAIHKHLVDRVRKEGRDLWPSENLDCGESYEDVWDEEPSDEIAALAFAIPGEVK